MPAINSKPTQAFVPIKEVRDGVAILKDSSMRAIVMASSLNFALKSEENQQAIILQFQNFLNSLDFTAQIFLQSRRLDIRPYLSLLEQRFKEQTSELMKVQTREYIEFIRSFTENSNIMTKTFFVVVPYAPAVLSLGNSGAFGGVFGKKSGTSGTEEQVNAFEEHKSQLDQRVSVVEQGLARCGIRTARLGTEEIIELFYKLFNPGSTDKAMHIA
ncbi:MAG: hypothetical protein WCT19_02375 [Candidatus Paceibacterota bacterium]